MVFKSLQHGIEQNKLTNDIRRKRSFSLEYPTKISNNTLRVTKGIASDMKTEYAMKTSQKQPKQSL